jgi:ERCC4-type nuclease
MGIQVVRVDVDVHEPAAIRYELERLGAEVRVEGLPRPLYAQRAKESTAEAVLAAIPDISTITARALLTHFGSIDAIVSATDVDLTDVQGIGPVRAQRLRQAFTQRHSAYRSRRSRE